MMRNVNQWSGVVALIAVGCLVAFGPAGERIVTPAGAQLTGSGGTGQAVSLAGCNRCAWSYKTMDFNNLAPGTDIVILPRGTSGAVRWSNFFPLSESDIRVSADCLEQGATGFWTGVPRSTNGVLQDTLLTYAPADSGIRFIDGLIVRYTGSQAIPFLRLTLEYRVD